MNADIGYNGRVANQAASSKAELVKEIETLCKNLGVEIPTVYTSDVPPQLSETNTWIAQQVEKIRRINIAVGALEVA